MCKFIATIQTDELHVYFRNCIKEGVFLHPCVYYIASYIPQLRDKFSGCEPRPWQNPVQATDYNIPSLST